MGKYKKYDKDFKKTLVELKESKAKTYGELSREYGISKSTLRDWNKKYGTIVTNIGENTTNKELDDLRKELKKTKQENEILKKAVAIFTVK